MEFEATRWCAEADGGSQTLDVVCVDTDEGGIQMTADQFKALFGVELEPNKSKAYRLLKGAAIEEIVED